MGRISLSHQREDGRWQCDLCPHGCVLKVGQTGVCHVRQADGEGIRSLVYGEPAATHVDPIEKKPLNHFFPGERIFSLGTLGCNLRCCGCQNDSLSRAAYVPMGAKVPAERIVEAAERAGCRMIAYTYNEPIVWAEYAYDIACLAKKAGMKNVLVSAGYIRPEALAWFLEPFDAANIDLKGFCEEFYRSWANAGLQPVLDAIETMHRKPGFWLELTTLVIPGINDSDEALREEFAWIVSNLGRDVPLHLSAFHPACEALEIESTPLETIERAAVLAREAGIHFVYPGNVPLETATRCAACGAELIRRFGFRTQNIGMKDGACAACGAAVPGVWK